MPHTREIEEKMQAAIGLEPLCNETDSATESKEEIAEVRISKEEADQLNKKFLASYENAFRALCIAIFPTGTVGLVPAFYFLGKIPSNIFVNNIFPFLVSEIHFKNRDALKHVDKLSGLFFRGQLFNVRLKQLLQHIAYGNKKQAEAIIAEDPRLLLLSGPIVKDYAGRLIQQTAYQMAIAMGDVFLKFKNGEHLINAQGEEMKEMIERYVIMLLGEEQGVAELERQKRMIIPDNFAELLSQKRAQDLLAVREMFALLRNAEESDEAGLMEECGKALKKFKNYLKPKGIITTTTPGYHFDLQILVEAYKLYNADELNFGGRTEKSMFAWQKIIGSIQRHLTACDVMILCQSAYKLVLLGKNFERRSKHSICGIYLPLDSHPEWLLGVNAAIGKKGAVSDTCSKALADAQDNSLEIICRAKDSALQKPILLPADPAKSWCLTM